jgi:hypothetical protein
LVKQPVGSPSRVQLENLPLSVSKRSNRYAQSYVRLRPAHKHYAGDRAEITKRSSS